MEFIRNLHQPRIRLRRQDYRSETGFALNIPFYDKEIIAMTAEESGLSIDFIKETEERKTGNFFTDIFQSTVTPSIDNKFFLPSPRLSRKSPKKNPV